MKRRTMAIVLASALLVFFVAAAVGLLLKSPPVTITVVGKTGQKYYSGIILDVRLQNHRLWPIYYHGQGGSTSASYRISRRTDSGWQKLNPEQYAYVFPIVRERIEPLGSTTICVCTREIDSSKESRIGLDCYTLWDCEMMGWRWGRPFSFPTTVWSMPQHIDCAKRSLQGVHIMVEEDGSFGIGGTCVTWEFLTSILKKASAEYGQAVTIEISSRKGTDQQKVSPVIDLCTSMGITNIILKTIDAPLKKDAQ